MFKEFNFVHDYMYSWSI